MVILFAALGFVFVAAAAIISIIELYASNADYKVQCEMNNEYSKLLSRVETFIDDQRKAEGRKRN